VIVALERLRSDTRPVCVYTDSIYVTNMWAKWFPVWKENPEVVMERKNLKLVTRLMELFAQKHVQVFHVNAHTRFVEEISDDPNTVLANVVTKCNRIAD
jgi:ribonuclease HI